jgi:5-oxoprolinase (ATP-hydrolysing)
MKKWKFFADRGGTFTDLVAIDPDGRIIIYKLLSENPERYRDAIVRGIRDILNLPANAPIPSENIEVVKIGTTVATNALLERKGDEVVLLITKGFGDALRIGYQNRPNIFALSIDLPEMLYKEVIEVEQRYDARGNELIPLDVARVKADLEAAYQKGIRSCAISFMHAYRYPDCERQVAQIAREIGFTQISVSHKVSPLMKLVSRGDTTVVDAYLSPILRRYVDRVASELNGDGKNQIKLMFMQSNGGLADARQFQGKDSILSGPAGGIVGAVQTSIRAGLNKIITFDMGGTSTDVAHFNGEYERQLETEIAGVRMRSPMMAIHTVAAGGSSILSFDGARYRVGPDSAGANPGPACYRRGGPLCITDANVMLGKIQSDFFPKVFGLNGDLPLDEAIVRQKFTELAAEIEAKTGSKQTPEAVAAGFIEIAVENMANAIKKISLQRGYDVSEYTLCCFGGAGGQHACLIADTLGIEKVFIHPYAGVLSAYGMGLADIRSLKQRTVEAELNETLLPELESAIESLIIEGKSELNQNEEIKDVIVSCKLNLKYSGTDSTLTVDFAPDIAAMRQEFEEQHASRYGFIQQNKALLVESILVEQIQKMDTPEEPTIERTSNRPATAIATVSTYTAGRWQDTPVFQRDGLQPGDCLAGPAIIIDRTGTNIIEPSWQAELNAKNHLILQRSTNRAFVPHPLGRGEVSSPLFKVSSPLQQPDPVRLEIFQNLFQSIAEEMGITLQNTAASVNIKERLDFSCAIFDRLGNLVANAPHIPVHLGSMSESVRSLIVDRGNNFAPGDAYISNNPYNGGTHLPDVTVITPVFERNGRADRAPTPIFYVASRGHQADIGGITPGSMPPQSTTIEEEGISIDNFQLVDRGHFRETEIRALLQKSPYPARNSDQNIADFKAQIAANAKGVRELDKMVAQYGLDTVENYMNFVQANAEESVRRAIEVLKDGEFTYSMDNEGKIAVKIEIDRVTRSAKIDFTGTSAQLASNFNAPKAVCQAAVLYVFRTLVNDTIPLNSGCLKPLEIIIPSGCMLDPNYPAAVVAGNVETSQTIVDALYGALGIMSASQGTMNNFTFGNDIYQYYETICGGSGAGVNFNGTDAVHTHMTNSRLTDPEVLEWRFPVLLEEFKIRRGSGGVGLYRGGDGVIRRLRFLEPMSASILSGHRIVPPFGLAGGKPGQLGRNWIQRQDGTVEELGSTAIVNMLPGDTFIIETPGGGGFGND